MATLKLHEASPHSLPCTCQAQSQPLESRSSKILRLTSIEINEIISMEVKNLNTLEDLGLCPSLTDISFLGELKVFVGNEVGG